MIASATVIILHDPCIDWTETKLENKLVCEVHQSQNGLTAALALKMSSIKVRELIERD